MKKKQIKAEFDDKPIDSAIEGLHSVISAEAMKMATTLAKKSNKEFLHYYSQARGQLLKIVVDKFFKANEKQVIEDFAMFEKNMEEKN